MLDTPIATQQTVLEIPVNAKRLGAGGYLILLSTAIMEGTSKPEIIGKQQHVYTIKSP